MHSTLRKQLKQWGCPMPTVAERQQTGGGTSQHNADTPIQQPGRVCRLIFSSCWSCVPCSSFRISCQLNITGQTYLKAHSYIQLFVPFYNFRTRIRERIEWSIQCFHPTERSSAFHSSILLLPLMGWTSVQKHSLKNHTCCLSELLSSDFPWNCLYLLSTGCDMSISVVTACPWHTIYQFNTLCNFNIVLKPFAWLHMQMCRMSGFPLIQQVLLPNFVCPTETSSPGRDFGVTKAEIDCLHNSYKIKNLEIELIFCLSKCRTLKWLLVFHRHQQGVIGFKIKLFFFHVCDSAAVSCVMMQSSVIQCLFEVLFPGLC